MSDSKLFVSKASIRNLKKGALTGVPEVASSHVSEALASAMGFRTYAALLAALDGKATAEACKPSNAKFAQRLKDLGYPSVPQDLKVVPEFNHSYTPFRVVPLRKKRGVRWWAWRNLVVAAINAGLEAKVFGLSPGENWWQPTESNDAGSYFFSIDEAIPAIVSVTDQRADELSLEIVLNPRRKDVLAKGYLSSQDGDAFAHCWVERRLGAWIQDACVGFSCKRGARDLLVGMSIEPQGYSDLGSFIL